MARLSLKKCLRYTAQLACVSLLLIGMQLTSLYSVHDEVHQNAEPSLKITRFRTANESSKELDNEVSSTSTARNQAAQRAWFFSEGSQLPAEGLTPAIWPEDDDGDRIVNQLNYRLAASTGQVKTILLYNGWSPSVKMRSHEFERNSCPVRACELTMNHNRLQDADAVLFKDHFKGPSVRHNLHQVWIMYMLESALNTRVDGVSSINWTATYRHDSDIVAPYARWVYYDEQVHSQLQRVNYAANKTKKVAWFVSNCASSNLRLEYAKELAKHIDVDIYGSCGTKRCPRFTGGRCFEMLNMEYKFYLAFENSNCRDYITEKFFVNGLKHNILPIVMGAHPDDYRRAAPEHSYLHVDDFESPRHLADFLKQLDRDDHLYNTFFHWKDTGEFINTFFFCRLCAALHAPARTKTITDLRHWWIERDTCVNGRWPQPAVTQAPRTAAAVPDSMYLLDRPPMRASGNDHQLARSASRRQRHR